MSAEATAAATRALTYLVYFSTVAAWAALAVLVVFLRLEGKDTGRGRFTMMLIWLVLTCIWLSVASYLRLFTAYRSPTVLLSLARSIIDNVSHVGLLGIFGARLVRSLLKRRRGR